MIDSDSGSVIQSCVHPDLSNSVDFAKPSASGCQLECSSTVEETNPSTSNSVVDSTTERDDGSITKGRTDNRPRSLRAPQEKNCVTVKLSTLPTDTSRLCQIFKIKHASIFCGGEKSVSIREYVILNHMCLLLYMQSFWRRSLGENSYSRSDLFGAILLRGLSYGESSSGVEVTLMPLQSFLMSFSAGPSLLR